MDGFTKGVVMGSLFMMAIWVGVIGVQTMRISQSLEVIAAALKSGSAE